MASSIEAFWSRVGWSGLASVLDLRRYSPKAIAVTVLAWRL
jgi:hypothetical protein